MFARVKLRTALFSSFNFFQKLNFSLVLNFIKKPFYAISSTYFKNIFLSSKKFFRWYDKPIFLYAFSSYFFKFITLKRGLLNFLKKKKEFVNFKFFFNNNSLTSSDFKKFLFFSDARTQNKNNKLLLDSAFFKYYFLKPNFFAYSNAALKNFRFFYRNYSKINFKKVLLTDNFEKLIEKKIFLNAFWKKLIKKKRFIFKKKKE